MARLELLMLNSITNRLSDDLDLGCSHRSPPDYFNHVAADNRCLDPTSENRHV